MQWKLKFKTREDVLEEVEKFCYLDDFISCYGGASEAVRARICSLWKNFWEWCVSWEARFIFEAMGKIYQCCVRPVLMYCCET